MPIHDDKPRSHPAAQALLAGIMMGVGEKYGDETMIKSGRQLGDNAIREDAAQRMARAVSEGFPLDAEGRPTGVRFIGWATEPRPALPQESPRPWWRRWWLAR
jgi:hypothetical protein